MIIITGDCHGEFKEHFSLFDKTHKGMFTKNDYMIVCGDFGIWDQYTYEELKYIEELPWTTLFIDGNHENYDILDNMEEIDWHGGKVHKFSDSIIHLMRGHVFDIDNRKVFAFGGAA